MGTCIRATRGHHEGGVQLNLGARVGGKKSMISMYDCNNNDLINLPSL